MNQYNLHETTQNSEEGL